MLLLIFVFINDSYSLWRAKQNQVSKAVKSAAVTWRFAGVVGSRLLSVASVESRLCSIVGRNKDVQWRTTIDRWIHRTSRQTTRGRILFETYAVICYCYYYYLYIYIILLGDVADKQFHLLQSMLPFHCLSVYLFVSLSPSCYDSTMSLPD